MDRISAIFYIPMAVHHVQNLAGYLLSGHIYGFSNQLLLNIWSIGTYLLNNRVCHNRPNCKTVAGSPLGNLEDCLNADINGCNAFIGNTVHPTVYWIFTLHQNSSQNPDTTPDRQYQGFNWQYIPF